MRFIGPCFDADHLDLEIASEAGRCRYWLVGEAATLGNFTQVDKTRVHLCAAQLFTKQNHSAHPIISNIIGCGLDPILNKLMERLFIADLPKNATTFGGMHKHTHLI